MSRLGGAGAVAPLVTCIPVEEARMGKMILRQDRTARREAHGREHRGRDVVPSVQGSLHNTRLARNSHIPRKTTMSAMNASAVAAAAPTLISPSTSSRRPITNSAAGRLAVDFSSLRHRCGFRLTCSYSIRRDDDAASFVDRARPQEITWSKELTNSVHLIGVVGVPVEIRNLASGKAVAWTRLAVRKSATETSWINLTFWDELAQTAFQYVEKGQQIYVSGRLVSDEVDGENGKQQIYYKVVVQQLNFIERSMPSPTFTEQSSYPSSSGKVNDNPLSAGSIAELWQAFFANPLEWWDNRRNKRNPKYPDFKHKDTGEALWVKGKYNPAWVKPQLAILDSRMGSSREQSGRMPVSAIAGDDVLSY